MPPKRVKSLATRNPDRARGADLQQMEDGVSRFTTN
ncbi:hypothetical protein EYZ11_005202 [Aspergillus tanneri]|uniref:Uncharacterized protein n=1 Tax=Aspergillus tanneri TaxID=1220188 RepID=A0A4S3JJ02_9EURO|nr:hypothetical protein EYZ11_005202 [Aspergillus tanneri]